MHQNWRWGATGSPFTDLQDALSSLLDDWLGPVPAGEARFPRTELRRTDEADELLVALPGVPRSAVELSVEGRLLLLEGERTLPELPEGAELVRRERASGRFRRTVQLPESVDGSGISALMQDGVLHVNLPHREPERPREITIAVEEAES
jgi:HSP20 family protein